MDSLEYTRALIQSCLNADYTLQFPGDWVMNEPALVVDAKALYDSIRAKVPQRRRSNNVSQCPQVCPFKSC